MLVQQLLSCAAYLASTKLPHMLQQQLIEVHGRRSTCL
jgi:hypothetical protein